jgi:hypothetical protein
MEFLAHDYFSGSLWDELGLKCGLVGVGGLGKAAAELSHSRGLSESGEGYLFR